jgi:hypothetical protein
MRVSAPTPSVRLLTLAIATLTASACTSTHESAPAPRLPSPGADGEYVAQLPAAPAREVRTLQLELELEPT